MSGIFGGGSPVQAPPKTLMPDESDPSILAARKRQYEIATARSGRASTMLSDAYSNDKLGGRA